MTTESDDETTSTAVRHPHTNDALAILLIASTVGAVVISVVMTGSIPSRLGAVFAVESLLAATWAFGRETLGAVAEIVPSPWSSPPRGRQPAASRRAAAQNTSQTEDTNE